jgi:preprotein translocase SecE subunit
MKLENKTTMNRPSGGGGATTRPPSQPSRADREARALALQSAWSGLLSEMRRVTWPTRQQWVSATVLTVILVVFVGLFTFGVDEIFGFLFGLIRPGR